MHFISSLIFVILIISTIDANINCGRVIVTPTTLSNTDNLTSSYSGQWPWLASLFRDRIGLICGASIISQWHLLTAAQCAQGRTADYHALLGRFDLSNSSELNWLRRKLSDIYIHEDYNFKFITQKSDGDIAVLRMSKRIEYTNYIQPICLPEKSSNVINVKGIVVGYKKFEFHAKPENTPKYIALRSIKPPSCNRVFMSKRSFCAVNENFMPCQGDLGGGFNVLNTITQQYTLFGITSYALVQCEPGDDVTFVNTAKYIPWIHEKMNETNPCDSTKCGKYTECEIIDEQASCSCLPDFTGTPPNCLPKCKHNSQCPDNQACKDGACKDLCSDVNACVNNSDCTMVNHKPVCNCKEGFVDYYDDVYECKSMSVFVRFSNETLCDEIDCGNQGQCEVVIDEAVCKCSTDFIGIYPDCVLKCSNDSQCMNNEACLNDICVDLCSQSSTCSVNSICSVKDHKVDCNCEDGYIGNGFKVCKENPCIEKECGYLSECQVINDEAVCSCLSNSVGVYPDCIPKCADDLDCLVDEACFNNICTNLCLNPETCSENANCMMRDSKAECTCKDGFIGDGFNVCKSNPCDDKKCGYLSKCEVINYEAVCSCSSYAVGTYPNCVLKCSDDSQCMRDEACLNDVCIDLCSQSSTCSENSICSVKNHKVECKCKDGFIGDGFKVCKENPCEKKDCQHYGQCEIINEKAVCSCSSNYFGVYPDCMLKCTDDSQCSDSQACEDNVCTNLCLKTKECVANSHCSMKNHMVECNCNEGYLGDGFTKCSKNLCDDVNCNEDNEICKVVDHKPECICKIGYVGTSPNCVASCSDHSDCLDAQSCLDGKCFDPCSDPDSCAENSNCVAVDHEAECSCKDGYEGDGYYDCDAIQ